MLALCREQRLEHRTKHIALRYFLARELQQRGQLRLAYVASEANTADVFTKALAPCDHQRCCTFALLCLTGLVATQCESRAIVSVAGCRATLSCGTTALVTPPCLAFVACTLASWSLVFLGLCLPSLPRLRRPAFLASRDGSAPLLTPPRSLPQRLHCRLSTWTCGAQPASVDRATSGTSCWLSTTTRLREQFQSEFPVLRLHSDRGGEFSSDLLAAFCAEHGIRQTFTLPASPQQNGVAERRIGLVMEVARTSMIHAAAPHFLWPFAVRYAAHQLNLWPRVSLPETSPTLLWTGKVGDASRFRVWGARAFVRDTTADKLSPRAIPCVFLGFVLDEPGWQFYDLASRHVFASQDVTFDELVPFYCLFPYRTAPRPPPPLFLAPGPPQVDPLPAPGPAPSGVSQLGGAESGGAESGRLKVGR
ncbi:unnamed protein product [Closterium sp. NIES-53]